MAKKLGQHFAHATCDVVTIPVQIGKRRQTTLQILGLKISAIPSPWFPRSKPAPQFERLKSMPYLYNRADMDNVFQPEWFVQKEWRKLYRKGFGIDTCFTTSRNSEQKYFFAHDYETHLQ